MNKALGLTLIILTISLPALAGPSATLFLKASIPPQFRIDLSHGVPKLASNMKEFRSKPIIKVEKQGQSQLVTIIQP